MIINIFFGEINNDSTEKAKEAFLATYKWIAWPLF